jgi:hypothetical protein
VTLFDRRIPRRLVYVVLALVVVWLVVGALFVWGGSGSGYGGQVPNP